MRRRTPRGFTLVELGIVIGIAIFLTLAVAVTIKGFTQSARTQRTGEELATLSRVAVTALKRGLVREAIPGTWSFRTTGGAGSTPFTANTPLCYDLSRSPGGNPNCPGTSTAGANWSAPYYSPVNAIPGGSPLLSALGGSTQMANNGYNPWCLPYVICLYPARAEVLTCVPTDDLDATGLESAMRCGTCTTPIPGTNEPASCVLFAASSFSQAMPAAALSFDADEPGVAPGGPALPAVYITTPRTAF